MSYRPRALVSRRRRLAPAHLRRIHRSSDVDALLRAPIDELRQTLYVARDIYHEGKALGREPFVHMDRAAMVTEILKLRRDFMKLDEASRQALQVGHVSEVMSSVIHPIPVDAVT